jgi:UDP-N-acetylenolpyruvoylglucosamine reductase
VVFSMEQSQVIVDAGCPVHGVIVAAASKGLGGLVPAFAFWGTVGSAVAYNPLYNGQPFSSSVRTVTLLLPPTKMKPEPRLVRYSADWLLQNKEDMYRTRLADFSEQHGGLTGPVVLTAALQLTNIRPDEVARRLQIVAQQTYENRPKGTEWFGPLLHIPETVDLAKVARIANLHRFKYAGLSVDRRHPNFLRWNKRKVQLDALGNVPTETVLTAVSEIQARLQAVLEMQLPLAFSVVE